jgi:hypothetical protein
MTSPSYPASLDALANPGPTTETDDAGFELDIVVARLQNIVMAIEGKLGIGASTPVAGVLRRTTGTTTNWGTIQQLDIGAGQISQAWQVTGIPTSTTGQATTSLWATQPGATLALTGVTVGSIVLAMYSMQATHSLPSGRCEFRLIRTDTSAPLAQTSGPWGHATASQAMMHTLAAYFVVPVSPLTIGVQAQMIDGPATMNVNAAVGALYAVELRR